MFDAVVVGFVALAAGIGAWKGLAWQLGAVIAPVAGLAVAWPLSAGLAPHLSMRAPFDRWAAFALLYALVTLVVFAVAAWIRRALEKAELGAWDRHLGFVLGGLKGFLLAIVLTAAALAMSGELRDRVRESRAGGLMAQAVRTVRPALSPSASDLLSPWLDLLSFDSPAARSGSAGRKEAL
jgi:membrane protein required for colicin V production